jgi:hypothetical protein
MTHLFPTAETRSNLFFAMVHAGALAAALLLITLTFDLPDFVDGLPQGMLLVSLAVIMLRRLRDEYVEELWRAGTRTAFIAIVVACLVLPLAAGLTGRLAGVPSDPRLFTITIQWPLAVALLGFYGGFYARMLARRP